MPEIPGKPVLLTGVSGALGRSLARALGEQGWRLRLTDLMAFPDSLPPNALFARVDLVDGVSILQLAEGCSAILHFGGTATDRSFEDVFGPNLRGLYHIYEAARREGARVVFASSNHAIGFHPRTEALDAGCSFQPDSYYGLSKAYGELMGRLYWDKHGVESVSIRIGSCFPEPVDERMLSTWLSYGDLARLVQRCVLPAGVKANVIWGASANSRTWWAKDDRDLIGWAPIDSADRYAEQVAGKISGSAVQEERQGGAYAAAGFSRTGA